MPADQPAYHFWRLSVADFFPYCAADFAGSPLTAGARGACSNCKERHASWQKKAGGGRLYAYCEPCRLSSLAKGLSASAKRLLDLRRRFPGATLSELGLMTSPRLTEAQVARSIATLSERGLLNSPPPAERPAPAPPPAPEASNRPWLVYADEAGTGEWLPIQGEAHGKRRAAEAAARRLARIGSFPIGSTALRVGRRGLGPVQNFIIQAR